MSVIVVRDGVMATDSFGGRGDMKVPIQKMFKSDTAIVGWAGDMTHGRWFAQTGLHDRKAAFPTKETKDLDFIALVLYPNGRWEVWTEEMYPLVSEEYQWPYMAIGAGQEAAMAALHCGATAERAVSIACLTNVHCEGPTRTSRFND